MMAPRDAPDSPGKRAETVAGRETKERMPSDCITPEELPLWVPGEILLASDGSEWNGVKLRSYRYTSLDREVPPLSDYLIVVYRQGQTPWTARSHTPMSGSMRPSPLRAADARSASVRSLDWATALAAELPLYTRNPKEFPALSNVLEIVVISTEGFRCS
jgi:hypothetical protein